MTPKEYNATPEGDPKLVARLAITMGWHSVFAHQTHVDHYVIGDLLVSDPNYVFGFRNKKFDPFTDPSIPYGLIGRGIDICGACTNDGDFFAESFSSKEFHVYAKSLTHAIIQAFCAADPLGHWAQFINGETK